MMMDVMLFYEKKEAEIAPALGCVIAVHGRGATCQDLMPLVEALALPKLSWVFPQGPFEVPEFAPGKAWYEYPSEAHEGLPQSRQKIYELLEKIQSKGIPSHRISLLGFSQGAVMSLDVGIRYPKKLCGIVALSGYLFQPEALQKEKFPGALNAPIFQAHGTYDVVIPVELGQLASQALQREGFSVKFLEYPMDHQIIPEEMADIRKFLLELYPGAD